MPRVLAGSGFDSRSRCMCGRRTTLQLCSLCYSPLGSRDPARLEPTSTGATDRHHCSLDSSKTSTPYLVLASPADPVEDTINIVPGKNHFIYRLVGVHELSVVNAPTNPSNTKFQSTVGSGATAPCVERSRHTIISFRNFVKYILCLRSAVRGGHLIRRS